jgi:hypothetical protein
MPDLAPPLAYTIEGRYAIFDAIAAGGMASVHLGRLFGPAGFARTVAMRVSPGLITEVLVSAVLRSQGREMLPSPVDEPFGAAK